MSSSEEQHANDEQQRQLHHYHCFDPELELSRDAASFADILNNSPPHMNRNARSSSAAAAAACGSSVAAAVFNFTNCIVGAGAIGLGGAMAASGGLISCVAIVLVAVLVKVSLDLLIDLSVSTHHASYEDLGSAAFGATGKVLVLASKFAYAFGCLVAYTVVIQDNFGPALLNLIYDNSNASSSSWFHWLLGQDAWCTWLLSVCVILPLCLLRDMRPLASASVVSIVFMLSIVAIVIYLWWIDIDHIVPHGNNGTDLFLSTTTISFDTMSSSVFVTSKVYKHWFEVRWTGFLNNMGTFVFTFVCQHTVHLAYGSLKPELRNVKTWRKVSAASLSAACLISLAVGVFCYMTFWERTVSDIFKIYPDSTLIDLAKLLLCFTMILTFPLPFFSCRELLIVVLFPFATTERLASTEHRASNDALQDLEEPLLLQNEVEPDIVVYVTHTEDGEIQEAYTSLTAVDLRRSDSVNSTALSLDISVLSTRAIEAMNSTLLPGQERQLKLPYHIGLTCKLWFVVTGLAIAAPNLGDVLDLVGCASGTLIAFVLPSLFAMRLQGYSHVAALILVVGGVIGTVGTICSLKQFMRDAFGPL